MSPSRDTLARKLVLLFAGVGAGVLLIAAIAVLVWVAKSPDRDTRIVGDTGDGAVLTGNVGKSGKGGNRFTLRLGQGFRFADRAVVVNDVDQPDVVFRYVPKQLGGAVLRSNEISQQLEQGFEPTLTAPMPLLVSTHINSFDHKPDVASITTGDAAAYGHQAMVAATTRYALLQNQAGDTYLLTLDELETPGEKFDDWRIGFAYEEVQLPLGSAGGQINKLFPGKLVYRDWYQSKMILSVDLTTGKETAIADGTLPTTADEQLLGYGDTSGAYVVRGASGRILHTLRFDEQFMAPQLSPDGSMLAGWVHRQDADVNIGGTMLPGAQTPTVAVVDMNGREISLIGGYDDATWTPDGRLIATGKGFDAGLYEIDPMTQQVTPINVQVAAPYHVAVSPDGRTIAFVTGERVWLIGRDGRNLRQLFQHGASQQRPAFSPDGAKIAFIICNHLGVDATGDVFVTDLHAKEITQLRTNTGGTLVPDTTSRLNWIR